MLNELLLNGGGGVAMAFHFREGGWRRLGRWLDCCWSWNRKHYWPMDAALTNVGASLWIMNLRPWISHVLTVYVILLSKSWTTTTAFYFNAWGPSYCYFSLFSPPCGIIQSKVQLPSSNMSFVSFFSCTSEKTPKGLLCPTLEVPLLLYLTIHGQSDMAHAICFYHTLYRETLLLMLRGFILMLREK